MAQNPTFVITMEDGREMKGELYQILPEDVTTAKERMLRSMLAKRSGDMRGVF